MGAARPDQDGGTAVLAMEHPGQFDPPRPDRRYRLFPQRRRGVRARCAHGDPDATAGHPEGVRRIGAVSRLGGVQLHQRRRDRNRRRLYRRGSCRSAQPRAGRLRRRAQLMQTPSTFRGGPDERGHFGIFGGRFVAETLMPLVLAVEQAYAEARRDPGFQAELDYYLEHYVGRPSPLYFAERLTRHFGGAKLYLKRDELNHTGAHKINNCLGQVLLARRMKKARIIAETGAGQHGVATATACALFDLPCVVYMGATDIERQKPNVFRMKLLGAEVIPV